MSVHINIRIPDELAARIDELAKAESMSQTAVIVNGLWAALSLLGIKADLVNPEEVESIQQAIEDPGKVKLLYPVKTPIKRSTALVRTPKKVFGPSRLEAILPDLAIAAGVWDGAPRPAHAPGCKCLMCQGK
jgi:hypothetical protein